MESRINSIYRIDKSLFPFLKWAFKVRNLSNKWLRMDMKKRSNIILYSQLLQILRKTGTDPFFSSNIHTCTANNTEYHSD